MKPRNAPAFAAGEQSCQDQVLAARICPTVRPWHWPWGKDLDASRVGLTEEWSNGPVEGFVHNLKLSKRQGYGTAGFELLGARTLAARRSLNEQFATNQDVNPVS